MAGDHFELVDALPFEKSTMTDYATGPVLCFGESLWNAQPEGLFPQGTPINVAFHLRQLGARAIPVTAVGCDTLGQELIRRLADWGIETTFVATLASKPTGLLRSSMGDNGLAPSTVEDAAGNWIEVGATLLDLASKAAALVFGLPADRAEHNRRQLTVLQNRCTGALKVFDVNPGTPFAQQEWAWELARTADIINIRHTDLARCLERPLNVDQLEAGARDLAAKTYCTTICVRADSHGAGLLENRKWHWANGRPVEILDSNGSSDAFLAALVRGFQERKLAVPQILECACRLAEFVASRSGATPAYAMSPQGEIVSLPAVARAFTSPVDHLERKRERSRVAGISRSPTPLRTEP